MNLMERATTQVQQQEVCFARQYSIQNLCEIVAQRDFTLVSSRKIASLLMPRSWRLRLPRKACTATVSTSYS